LTQASAKVGFGAAVIILLRFLKWPISNLPWSTTFAACAAPCCHQLLLDVWCLLSWNTSIVSSKLEMTAIKLNLLLLCLQAFPKVAILVCDRSVVAGNQ